MADNLNTQTLPKIDLDHAAPRLRASKQEYVKEQIEAGTEEGVNWATYHAEYSQLSKLDQTDLSDWWDSLECEDGKFAEWLDDLVKLDSQTSIFDSMCDRGVYPTDEFASGFVEGALAVFAAVRSKI